MKKGAAAAAAHVLLFYLCMSDDALEHLVIPCVWSCVLLMHVKCFTSAFLHFLCVVLSFTCARQTFYLSISAFLMNGLVFYLCMSDGILEHYYISCVSLPEHWCIQL